MQQADKLLLGEELAAYAASPLAFVRFAFSWGEGELKDCPGPDAWQQAVLEDIGKRLLSPEQAIRAAVASGHGIGKSALVAWLILWALATFKDTKGVVTANTETQLKTKTWAELAKWHRLFRGKALFTFTATAIFAAEKEHEKTWRLDMVPWSERNTEAFAGLHNQGKRILIIFDEASAIADSIWEVTEGALTDKNTQIIWCVFGNPTRNSGKFFDCFHKLRHRWQTRQIDSRTVQMTDKKQLAEWIEDYGEDSNFVKVRVRGMFPSASDAQFISSELVTGAQKMIVTNKQVQAAPVILGVDPAWTGADEFVIYLRQGLHAKMLARFEKNDDDGHMAGVIARFEDEYRADAVNIDKGFGTGLYSFGLQMGRSWFLVDFAGKAFSGEYENKRMEMWGELKKWLQAGGCIGEDPVLAGELTAPQAFINRRGRLQLESKDDLKKRGFSSPNRADALALTFARRVLPKDVARPARANTAYDIFKI